MHTFGRMRIDEKKNELTTARQAQKMWSEKIARPKGQGNEEQGRTDRHSHSWQKDRRTDGHVEHEEELLQAADVFMPSLMRTSNGVAFITSNWLEIVVGHVWSRGALSLLHVLCSGNFSPEMFCFALGTSIFLCQPLYLSSGWRFPWAERAPRSHEWSGRRRRGKKYLLKHSSPTFFLAISVW